MTHAGDRFRLELPHDPAFVATARLFASSLARHFEIEEDLVEDLKLAVSEACKRALALQAGGGSMLLTASRHNGQLVFEVSQGDVADEAARSAEELTAGLSLELIGALFEDAEEATGPEGQSVVRFSVPT